MNSKSSHYLYFAFTFVIAVFLILLGLFAIFLPWFPALRNGIALFITENSFAIFFFGATLMLIGIATIAGIVYGSKRRYYSIKSGPHQITLTDSVFLDYLVSYWKNIFPKADVPCTVKIKNNQVHVTADLPYIPLEKQKGLIEQMQRDVTEIFTRYLGYRAEYCFSVSFLDEAPDDQQHV